MRNIKLQYTDVLSASEQEFAFERLIAFLKKIKINHKYQTFSPVNTAHLLFLLKTYSSRSIAEIVFQEDDLRFGNQLAGRDVKRWAAEVLGILDEACGSWAN